MQIALLLAGLFLIIKSADILIDATSKLARTYGVSSFIIGITIIAFGTSAPELAVGVISGVNHTNGLSLGNIIGSSMSNMALIVGLSAILCTLQVRDHIVKRELPILLAVQLILGFMLIDRNLSRSNGAILILLFVFFMIHITIDAKKSARIKIDIEGDIDTDNDNNGLPPKSNEQRSGGQMKLWILSILSLGGLFLGGKLTVDSSTKIAQSFGLSETLIGLTVVALATTMPELITSIVAARKKEHEIVLGNSIGSNIFNILLVLGVSSSISPIHTKERLWFDIAAMIVLTLFVMSVSLLKKKIKRITGFILLFSYILYLMLKIIAAT